MANVGLEMRNESEANIPDIEADEVKLVKHRSGGKVGGRHPHKQRDP